MGLVTISRESLGGVVSDAQARSWCAQLEAGDILYFPETPVPIRREDIAFLLGDISHGPGDNFSGITGRSGI